MKQAEPRKGSPDGKETEEEMSLDNLSHTTVRQHFESCTVAKLMFDNDKCWLGYGAQRTHELVVGE